MNSSCSILQTHKVVVTEMALHLSVQTLFRCRAVCKLWRDVIDSPYFRKLHISFNKDEKGDGKVYLQLNYDKSDFKASMKIIDKGRKSLNLKRIARFAWKCITPAKGLICLKSDFKVSMKIIDEGMKSLNLNLEWGFERFSTKCVTLVKGLICFMFDLKPIVICNPFLGQFKTLPLSPILANPGPSCKIAFRNVAIGCDGEGFYKVVELVYCEGRVDGRLHAHLYSRRTDSWRELGWLDEDMCIPINNMSSCNDGHFAYWYMVSGSGGLIVLTFDMKNEVFRTTRIPDSSSILLFCNQHQIVAMDGGCSFIMFQPFGRDDELVRICEASVCEEEGVSKLSLNRVASLYMRPTRTPPWWRSGCVMLKVGETKVLFYDYVVRRFVGCFKLPACSDIFYCKGTFVSP